MKRNARGFTLMELMVVIVIVAILAAVAVPLYINYVNDARMTEARGAIGAVITAEQTFFQINGAYAALPTGFIANPQPNQQAGLNCDLTEALANWTVTVPTASATAYQVLAVGRAGRPTANLTVQYDYDRTTGIGTWTP